MRTFFSSPTLKRYKVVPLDVGKLKPRERRPAIRQWVDRTDFLVIIQGQYTYVRSWPRYAGIYGFTKNRPMLSIDAASINEGWSRESMVGPSPFLYLKWSKSEERVAVFNSSYFFDHLWKKRLTVPIESVRYRLQGNQGLFDEFAPAHRRTSEIHFEKWFPLWLNEAIFLAGNSS